MMRPPPAPPASLLAALLALAGCSSCGYTFDRDGGQASLASTGALPRVAVIPFDNATFRRGLEIELTRLLADEVRARSPRAPSGEDDADWLVRGTILRADERIYSEDDDDNVRESSIVIEVEVTIEDLTAEKVIGPYTFRERVPYSARAGRVSTLEQAETEALRDIAERIVYWLEAGHPERRA
jgi:hypothetical protein